MSEDIADFMADLRPKADDQVPYVMPWWHLYSMQTPVVVWPVDGGEVLLDGTYTSEQLRAIADHMDKHREMLGNRGAGEACRD